MLVGWVQDSLSILLGYLWNLIGFRSDIIMKLIRNSSDNSRWLRLVFLWLRILDRRFPDAGGFLRCSDSLGEVLEDDSALVPDSFKSLDQVSYGAVDGSRRGPEWFLPTGDRLEWLRIDVDLTAIRVRIAQGKSGPQRIQQMTWWKSVMKRRLYWPTLIGRRPPLQLT